MKISTKFALCFAVMAVLPLVAGSAIYLRSSAQFGKEMTGRGQALLAERITRDLKRATEQGAVSFERLRRDLLQEVRFLANDVVSRLDAAPHETIVNEIPSGFDIKAERPAPSSEQVLINLDRIHVAVAETASRDQVAGTLHRLDGLERTARTIYLRNRDLINTISVSFETGILASYPSGATKTSDDPREQDWYLRTLETGKPAWFVHPKSQHATISITAPLQRTNGIFAGVAVISVNVAPLLERILSAPHISPEASAYLFSVPEADPQLMPYQFANLTAGKGRWLIDKEQTPVLLDGDDAWLKVVSDIRTGVPGLEYIERQNSPEVWSFGPIGRADDATLHLAVSIPTSVINDARTRAETIVNAAQDKQIKNAIILAILTGVVAVSFAIFVARSLTNPIRKLHDAAAKLTEGDFSVRVNAGSRDELGALAEGFNQMVPALEEQVRVKQDLHIAEEIQQHLVGKTAPSLDGFEVAGRTIYCDETGGDYQDFIELPNGQLLALSGDVTGHGVGAAILMATARASIRSNAHHFDTVGNLVLAVNQQLSEDTSGGRSLSLLCVALRSNNKEIEWVSAGHDPAMIYDPAKDEFITLDGEDIPLGVDGSWNFTSSIFELPDNAILLATTDGVREARNKKGEQYGWARLKDVLRRTKAQACASIIEDILGDLDTFRGDAPTSDDVSILVIRPT